MTIPTEHFNPLIPRMILNLSNLDFEGKVSEDDLAKLHIICKFADTKIQLGEWPEEINQVLNEKVRELAKKEYLKQDTQTNETFQRSIGEKLIDLRINYKTNSEVNDFKSDFVINDNGTKSILMLNSSQKNIDNRINGNFTIKHTHIRENCKTYVIEEDRWNRLSDKQQNDYLVRLNIVPKKLKM